MGIYAKRRDYHDGRRRGTHAREINRQADRAEEMRPARIDRYALAVTLAGRFQQHSAEEIEKLLTGVWRERRRGWQSTKPR